MMKQDTFESLYHEELQDLYDAERQIVEALPDMADAASSDELKSAFRLHLEQTRTQLARLERVFAGLNVRPGSEISDGMRALLAEGRMAMSERRSSPVLDAALIAAAQNVEHYEISGYGTARTLAEMLGHDEAAALLERTLNEEKETDSNLSDIAETVVAGEEIEELEEAEVD